MADWPQNTAATRITSNDQTSNYHYTILTTGASNVYGAYSTCITTTTSQSVGMSVFVNRLDSTDIYNVEIATGSAGLEYPLWSFFALTASIPEHGGSLYLPINIPAGTRIAARAKSGGAGATIRLSISLAEN